MNAKIMQYRWISVTFCICSFRNLVISWVHVTSAFDVLKKAFKVFIFCMFFYSLFCLAKCVILFYLTIIDCNFYFFY